MICVIRARPWNIFGLQSRSGKRLIDVTRDHLGFIEAKPGVLEGRDSPERMPHQVRRGRAARCKYIDWDQFVADALFLEREARSPAVDAVRRTEHDRLSIRGWFCLSHVLSLTQKCRRAIAAPARLRSGRVDFDQAVVAQDGDPRIPVPAGRLFAEGSRELAGIHVAPTLRHEGAQHLGRRRRESRAPQIASRSAGVDGEAGTSPAAASPAGVISTRLVPDPDPGSLVSVT